jgi:hypothetical protein
MYLLHGWWYAMNNLRCVEALKIENFAGSSLSTGVILSKNKIKLNRRKYFCPSRSWVINGRTFPEKGGLIEISNFSKKRRSHIIDGRIYCILESTALTVRVVRNSGLPKSEFAGFYRFLSH